MSEHSEPVASVVIPAHNAADTLGRQLEALAQQVGTGPLEVIVVDNRSTDTTAAIALTFLDRLPLLRVVRADERAGPSYARNVGVAAAGTDRILFCDADDIVDRSWASHLLAGLTDADLVSGRSRWVDERGVFLHDDPPWGPALGFLPSFGTNNAAIRRDVFDDLGGFDETLPTAEDLDLAWRLQLAGHTMVKTSDAVVDYYQRGGPREILRREFRHGRGTPEIYLRYRSRGMPRSSTSIACKAWVMFILRAPFVWTNRLARRFWLQRVGTRSGRLWGSITRRTLYL